MYLAFILGLLALSIFLIYRNWNNLWKVYYRHYYPHAVIPCALCPEDIYPGMPVHLPSFRDPNRQPERQGAVPYTYANGAKGWVCCPYCADTAAEYQGTWQLDAENPGYGKVIRHMSALEAALNNGKGVISDGRGHNAPLD